MLIVMLVCASDSIGSGAPCMSRAVVSVVMGCLCLNFELESVVMDCLCLNCECGREDCGVQQVINMSPPLRHDRTKNTAFLTGAFSSSASSFILDL